MAATTSCSPEAVVILHELKAAPSPGRRRAGKSVTGLKEQGRKVRRTNALDKGTSQEHATCLIVTLPAVYTIVTY